MPGHYGKSSKGAASKKVMPKTDPTLAAGKLAKKAVAKKMGAEGPKRSVKGPVKAKAGGPGRGVAAKRPAKRGK